jgi:hypothetical protein
MWTLDQGQIQQCVGLGSHDKRRAHTGGMKIGKKHKKHYSIWCPHCRGINADTLK